MPTDDYLHSVEANVLQTPAAAAETQVCISYSHCIFSFSDDLDKETLVNITLNKCLNNKL